LHGHQIVSCLSALSECKMGKKWKCNFLHSKGPKMDEPATFDESDWAELTTHDKRMLTICARAFMVSFESLAKAPGMGQKSVDSLLAQGLLIEGDPNRHNQRTFRLTSKGVLAVEWTQGRKTRVYPQSS